MTDFSYAELDAEVNSWLEEQSADYQRWALEAFIEECEDKAICLI